MSHFKVFVRRSQPTTPMHPRAAPIGIVHTVKRSSLDRRRLLRCTHRRVAWFREVLGSVSGCFEDVLGRLWAASWACWTLWEALGSSGNASGCFRNVSGSGRLLTAFGMIPRSSRELFGRPREAPGGLFVRVGWLFQAPRETSGAKRRGTSRNNVVCMLLSRKSR